jgi:GxxExxY protein
MQDPRTYAIIGAAMEVHRELGPGFLEAAYQRALAKELGLRGIRFAEQVPVPLHYKGEPLGVPFRADVVVGDVLLELKALPALGRAERAQVAHYLKATQMAVGLLLNFGASSLQVERVVAKSPQSPESPESLESQAAHT